MRDWYKQHVDLIEGYAAQHKIIASMISNETAGVFKYSFLNNNSFGNVNVEPLSRGTIHISTTDPDPASPLLVDWGSMTHPLDDMQVAVLGVIMFRGNQ